MTVTPLSPFQHLLLSADPPILTEAELARRADINRSTIRHLREGRGGRLALITVSEVLGCTVDELRAVVDETIAWQADQGAERAA